MPDTARDHVLHALSDATRRHLLKGISAGKGSVAEISEAVAMSGPAVSKHLRALEACGLIERERAGRFHRFTMNPTLIEEAIGTLAELLRGTTSDSEVSSVSDTDVDVHLL